MHAEARSFIFRCASLFPDYFRKQNVIEIGSANINGSIRYLFKDCDYFGVDIHKAPGVDIVAKAHELDLTTDCVLYLEVGEHDENWDLSVAKCVSMARKMVIITCAAPPRPEHGTFKANPDASPATNHYYRNLMPDDLAPFLIGLKRGWFWYHKRGDLYFLGFKSDKPLFKPNKFKYLFLEIMAFFCIDRPRDLRQFIKRLRGKS